MIVDFINNAALLITLSAFYGVFLHFRKKNLLLSRILTGCWFGIIAVGGMMIPFQYQPGVIFDGRSIVLSLSGLYGGGLSSLFSILIAGFYRASLGGPGVWAGLSTILLCTAAGLLFRKLFREKPEEISFMNLLLIGIAVHIIMLACQLLFPWPRGLEIIKTIWMPVLSIFPIAFLLMSFVLGGQEKRFQTMIAIKQAESLYRTTLYSIGDAVITTNKVGQIQQMNKIAEQLTGWPENSAKGKQLDKVLKLFSDPSGNIDEAAMTQIINLKPDSDINSQAVLKSSNGSNVPVSVTVSPIKDGDSRTSGVVIVFRDQTEQRAKQKLLETNEAKYRYIVESTDAIAWEFDIHTDKWTYISPQVEDKLGWSPQEWTNFEFWQQKLHPDEREWATNYCNARTAKGEDHSMEYRFLTKNGSYLWLRDIISVETNGGKPVKLRGIMLDINSRKKTELDLKEKNNFIQTVLDFLPIGLALNEIDNGNLIYTNRKYEDVYGWSIEYLRNPEIFKNIFPDEEYRNTILARIDADIKSGNIDQMHWENIDIQRQDGSRAVINMVNIPLFEQNIMVSTVMDITFQKQAEMALKESEEHFRKLFENHSAVHILIESPSGKIVNANQSAAEFYGYTIDELKEMRIHQINTVTPEETNEAIKEAKRKKKLYIELKQRLANGEIRDVVVFSSVVELMDREFIYSIIHDITEKKQLLNELIKAKTTAEENDRLKTAFLANMSHEIRTPLNGILGFTELLTSSDSLTNLKRERYSKIIKRSAESLMQIINDILDISKLETGQMRIVNKNFLINDTLNNIYTLYFKKLDDNNKKDIRVELKQLQEKVTIFSDENRLSQVFNNLLDNAIKFTPKGVITFGVEALTNEAVSFFVADPGIGIAKEKQAIIFERFIQANEDISINYGGNGLGLSIVKKLVELMGGKINVESTVGIGTTFRFYLPLNAHQQ